MFEEEKSVRFRQVEADSLADVLRHVQTTLLAPEMARIGWRGQADAEWEIRSALFRRLRGTRSGGQVPNREVLSKYKYDLIARSMGLEYYGANYAETWAKLQHHGAATHFLDVTRDPFIALWFASSGAVYGAKAESAALFALNLSRSHVINSFDSHGSGSFEEAAEDGGALYVPAWSNERIKAQRACFVDWALFDEETKQQADARAPLDYGVKIVFASALCEEILELLERKFGISESTLFPDFQGFAMSNGPTRRPIPLEQLLSFE